MTGRGGGDVSAHVIPDDAVAEWKALSRALAAHGPTPREELPMPDAWWPAGHGGTLSPWEQDAVEACGWCPVRAECLAYALAAGERHGVWGGLLPTERHSVTAA